MGASDSMSSMATIMDMLAMRLFLSKRPQYSGKEASVVHSLYSFAYIQYY